MKLRKKLLLLAALSLLATGAISGVPVAYGHDEPAVHPTCTWGVDKTSALASNPSTAITTLNLALNQTSTIQYKVVVTRTCPEGFDPAALGNSSNVIDTYAGTLAEHLGLGSRNLSDTWTFRYTRDITARSCADFDVVNKVDVIDSDPTKPFATDTHTLHVDVRCETGCTLTQGYWKTHSTYGPASKPDPAWNLLPGGLGPNTVFFLSGASWYQVFWTSPAGGNAYYALAHQYMAARLNVLNGASASSSVTSAISTATSLFGSSTPAQIGALSSSSSLRKQFVALAATLASYNEGLTGPGHCDE